MGIHNEPGNRRVSPVPPLNNLIPQLLEHLLSTSDPERSFLPFKGKGNGDKVVLLVNNLGGTSELELGAIVKESVKGLKEAGVEVVRVLSGTFMVSPLTLSHVKHRYLNELQTSLNMPGFSLTLLLLPHSTDNNAPDSAKVLSLLDAPANAPGWKWSSSQSPSFVVGATATTAPSGGSVQSEGGKLKASDPTAFIDAVKAACKALIDEEPEITRMDNIAGDGDCGLTLKDGANGMHHIRRCEISM